MEPFRQKPTIVQLTEMRAARVPDGSSWMVFDVDSLAPSRTYPGEWIVHVRDYRYGKDPQECWGAIIRSGRWLLAIMNLYR